MTFMHYFDSPSVLWLLVGWILSLVLLKYRVKTKNNRLFSESLLPWILEPNQTSTFLTENTFRVGSFWLGGCLLIIALAGPRIEVTHPFSGKEAPYDQAEQSSIKLMMAIDLSKSMQTRDGLSTITENETLDSISRFQYAQSIMTSIKNQLESSTSLSPQLGLIGFEASAHLVLPFTNDMAIWQHFLSLITPEMMPTKGSSIESAVILGVNRILAYQRMPYNKVGLVIFTDGRASDELMDKRHEKAYQIAIEKIQQHGIKVILVGVGKNQQGYVPDSTHPSGNLHHHGQPIKTRLDEDSLTRLATQLEATFLRADEAIGLVKKIINEVLQTSEAQPSTQNKQTTVIWQDFSLPFVLFGLILLSLAWLGLPSRKAFSQKTMLSLLTIVSLSGLISLLPIDQVTANEENAARLAFEALHTQDYDQALTLYESLGAEMGGFGAGVASYLKEDYPAAIFLFRQSFLAATNDERRGQSLYNLGNAYLKTNQIQLAIESYQNALRYRPNHANTRQNLAFANARLAMVKPPLLGQGENDQGQGGGKGNEDAFYGGQKANPDGKSVGEDIEGVGQSVFVLPSIKAWKTEQDLENRSRQFEITGPSDTFRLTSPERQTIKKGFEFRLKQLDAKESEFLQRIFEREEGYQATQNQRHSVPGVNPW